MTKKFEVGQRVLVPGTVVPAIDLSTPLARYPFIQVKLDSGDLTSQLVERPRVGTVERLDALEEFWDTYKEWPGRPFSSRLQPAYDVLIALETPPPLKRSVALENVAREARNITTANLSHSVFAPIGKALRDLDKSEPD